MTSSNSRDFRVQTNSWKSLYRGAQSNEQTAVILWMNWRNNASISKRITCPQCRSTNFKCQQLFLDFFFRLCIAEPTTDNKVRSLFSNILCYFCKNTFSVCSVFCSTKWRRIKSTKFLGSAMYYYTNKKLCSFFGVKWNSCRGVNSYLKLGGKVVMGWAANARRRHLFFKKVGQLPTLPTHHLHPCLVKARSLSTYIVYYSADHRK